MSTSTQTYATTKLGKGDKEGAAKQLERGGGEENIAVLVVAFQFCSYLGDR